MHESLERENKKKTIEREENVKLRETNNRRWNQYYIIVSRVSVT